MYALPDISVQIETLEAHETIVEEPAVFVKRTLPEESYFTINKSWFPALVKVSEPKIRILDCVIPVIKTFPKTSVATPFIEVRPFPIAPFTHCATPEELYFTRKI